MNKIDSIIDKLDEISDEVSVASTQEKLLDVKLDVMVLQARMQALITSLED